LSRAQADRQLVGVLTVQLFRGAQIGCYTCHNGPNSENANTTAAPTVANLVTNTASGQAVTMTLPTTGTGLTLRIVSQPGHGSAGLSGSVATYFPEPGFVGSDTFTFAAYNGAKNSALGTATIAVGPAAFSISATAMVPPNYPENWPAPFGVIATPSNINATPTYNWNFGDGSAHSFSQYAGHAYSSPGSYNWSVISTVQSGATQSSATNIGTIVIEGNVTLSAASFPTSLLLGWPNTTAGCLLEESPSLGTDARWSVVPNVVNNGANSWIAVPHSTTNKFYRLRKL